MHIPITNGKIRSLERPTKDYVLHATGIRTFPHAFCYLKRIQHPVQIQSMFQWLSQFDDGNFERKGEAEIQTTNHRILMK